MEFYVVRGSKFFELHFEQYKKYYRMGGPENIHLLES